MNRYRWAWFALACLVATGWAWVSRYEYHDCHRGVCVAVNRWTGELHRAEADVVIARRQQAAGDQARWDSLTALGQDTMTVAEGTGSGDARVDEAYERIAAKYRGGENRFTEFGER